jgi:DNA-binding protein H-NS
MTTYADVKKQIAQLEKKAADLRKVEVAKVVANIREQMAKYELTVEDIAPGKSARREKKATQATKTKVGKPAKYMDPKTGKTWTGHGKAPGWIAAATKAGRRDDFLIEKVSQVKATKPAEKSKPVKPVAAKKAPTAAKKVATKKVATRKPKAPAKKTPAVKIASPANTKPAAAKAKPARQTKKVAKKGPAKPTAKSKAITKSVAKPAKKSPVAPAPAAAEATAAVAA